MKLNYLFNDFKDCERAAKASLLKSKQRRKQQFQHSIEHLKQDAVCGDPREKWASELPSKNLNSSAHKSNPALMPARNRPAFQNSTLRDLVGLHSSGGGGRADDSYTMQTSQPRQQIKRAQTNHAHQRPNLQQSKTLEMQQKIREKMPGCSKSGVLKTHLVTHGGAASYSRVVDGTETFFSQR